MSSFFDDIDIGIGAGDALILLKSGTEEVLGLCSLKYDDALVGKLNEGRDCVVCCNGCGITVEESTGIRFEELARDCVIAGSVDICIHVLNGTLQP